MGGNSIDEYLDVFNQVNSKVSQSIFDQFFYELNISCPNTDDGKCLSDDKEGLKALLTRNEKFLFKCYCCESFSR